MKRKAFIKNCCYACLGTLPVVAALQGCSTGKMFSAKIDGDDMMVPLRWFVQTNGNKKTYRRNIIIQNSIIRFPIYVTRYSDTKYSAVYMQCTHQGAGLSAYGDTLQCAAHGSRFDTHGTVLEAPATKPLRTFAVTILKDELHISLKAI